MLDHVYIVTDSATSSTLKNAVTEKSHVSAPIQNNWALPPMMLFDLLKLPDEMILEILRRCSVYTSTCAGLTCARIYRIHFALNGPVYILTPSPDHNTGHQPLYLAIGSWIGDDYEWDKLYDVYRPVGKRGTPWRKSKRYQVYARRRRAEERNRALHPWLEEHGGKNESREVSHDKRVNYDWFREYFSRNL
jgi:hypothetical protein